MAEFDLLLKLFDTLKDASKETDRTIQTVLTNQNEIANYIKHIPFIELRNSIKEHDKEVKDDVENCTDVVHTTNETLLEQINKVKTKVSKMITVVLVTFSVFISAVFIAKFTMTDPLPSDIKKTMIELKATIEKETKQQNIYIEELRKSIKKFQEQ